MQVEDPRLDPYAFELPEGAIARTPPAERDGGRLLRATQQGWSDGPIRDLVAAFAPGDLLVVNDTRVLQARLFGLRPTGGRVEILVLGPTSAMVRPGRRVKVGERVTLLSRDGTPSSYGVVIGAAVGEGARSVQFDALPAQVMSDCGHVPLPPYMNREATAEDARRYQTVFATEPGAVAAPTASLHLTTAILDALKQRGVDVCRVTLHVGAGTFRNLRSEDLDRGRLHAERYVVPVATAEAIAKAKAEGRRITAVGTTVTRTLEAVARASGVVTAGEGETDLFIQPGFEFRVVDRLMTNFHLPCSSLLMLVCAFGGRDRVLAGYSEAIALGYRFYSYGDAMLLEPEERNPS
jgi:S-adenosylmethionine:tRNA ribosyltransferase-isomerase